MEKSVAVKFVTIVTVMLCINNFTSEAWSSQIDFLWKEQIWRGTTWFDKVLTSDGWLDKRDLIALEDNYQRVAKLKIIPILMTCGYGQKFTDFLWLTAYTVTECRALSEDANEDCWKRLEGCLGKGAHTVLELLLSFKQIYSLDRRLKYIKADIPVYGTLLAIKRFLDVTSVEKGLTKTEATWFNEKIVNFAKSLGDILDYTCKPIHSPVKREDLTIAFYQFYVDRLRSSMEFITEHLAYIGFRYSPDTNKVTYTVPAVQPLTSEFGR